MKREEVKKMLSEGIPKIPSKDSELLAMEYTTLVFSGVNKMEAYKEIFPHRYEAASERARKFHRSVKATIMSVINKYEEGKYIRALYSVGSENYYIRFIDKRTNLLENLYDVGMDSNEDMKHRLAASKIFLSSIPEPKKELTVKHEVDVKNDFKAKLLERQKELFAIANSENDIIDAEIEDEA